VGLHNNSLKFAYESRSERGWSTNGKNAAAAAEGKVPIKVAAGTI
jgi:hypothetical protein